MSERVQQIPKNKVLYNGYIYILYIQWSFFKMSVVEITVDGDGITVATHSQPGNKMK